LQRLLHALARHLVRHRARIAQLVGEDPHSHVARDFPRRVPAHPIGDHEQSPREVREETVLVPRADHSGVSPLTYLELHACPIRKRGEIRQSPPPRLPPPITAVTAADAGHAIRAHRRRRPPSPAPSRTRSPPTRHPPPPNAPTTSTAPVAQVSMPQSHASARRRRLLPHPSCQRRPACPTRDWATRPIPLPNPHPTALVER